MGTFQPGFRIAIATQDKTFAAGSVTAAKCPVFYKVDGNIVSAIPQGTGIQPFSGVITGNKYLFYVTDPDTVFDFLSDEVTPGSGGGTTELAYRTSVLSDNPLYYASLSQASAPFTPLAGTGNVTLVNGALPNQTGLLTGGKSVQTDGTNDYLTLPALSLSTYKNLLVEFIAYIDSDSSSGTLAFALAPSDNFDADGVAGDFIATFSGGGNAGYLAVKGNADSVGSYSQKTYPQPSFGARHHFAYYITNAGFTNLYIDGVAVTLTQLSAGASNTNNFLDNSVIKFMGFGTSASTKGRIEEIAIWGASAFSGLPASSRVQAHAALVS